MCIVIPVICVMCDVSSYEVMLRCWEENPAKRPSFSELRVTFESILMEAASYIQFSTLTDIQARYLHHHNF